MKGGLNSGLTAGVAGVAAAAGASATSAGKAAASACCRAAAAASRLSPPSSPSPCAASRRALVRWPEDAGDGRFLARERSARGGGDQSRSCEDVVACLGEILWGREYSRVIVAVREGYERGGVQRRGAGALAAHRRALRCRGRLASRARLGDGGTAEGEEGQ